MAEPTPAEHDVDYKSVAGQVTEGVVSYLFESEAGKAIITSISDVFAVLLATAAKAMTPIGVGLARGIAQSEDDVAPLLADIASAAASDLFGKPVPASAFKRRGAGGVPSDIGLELGRGFVDTIKGTGESVQPSEEPAARYLGMMVNLALEGWYQGFTFEFLSSLIPQFDVGNIETFAELDDTLAQALGLGRLSRRVLGPYIDNLVVTPLEWHVKRTYRPTLLGAGEAVRQYLRGAWTREQLDEELARQGYAHDRIEALILAAKKMFSVEDLSYLVRRELLGIDAAVASMREQGYDEQTASKILLIDQEKQLDTIRRTLANDAVSAYVARQIERSALRVALDVGLPNSQERDVMLDVADARQALNLKPLSSSEARACVKAGILASIDYRRALQREGRTPEAVDALDLLLRHELDDARRIEDLRDEQARERAAEKAARDDAKAKAQAAAEAARALARRGREADLERAVVRGRIPIARYVEVISQSFDADTVEIMVADVEDKRQQYLADEQKKKDAEQRAAAKHLDVGAARQAVLAGVLTIDEFRKHPAVTALDAADADILTRTLVAELGDRRLAQERKADAEQRAKTKGIDLAKYAELVRRGLRTLDDYRARLVELGYGPADVDAIAELLELQLADDAKAAATRAAAEQQAQAKGLSLEQLRRAVLAGDAPLADFEKFLLEQNYTDEARRALVAGLERELADVAAARARQQRADAQVGAPELPISELQRAARLGVISPADYRGALLARGFDELDAEIAVETVLNEIATTQSARALRAGAEQQAQAKGLSLAELTKAVKAGIKSLDDYRAALVAAGRTVDAVKTLVALLEDEVAQRKAAEARRTRIAERLAPLGVDLDALERAVIDGHTTIDDYSQTLAGAGVQPAEIGILVGLLVAQLGAA